MAKTTIALLMTFMMIAVLVPADAVRPVWDPNNHDYPRTVWSDQGKTGSVTGFVTTSVNGTVGIGGAYIAVVNASNTSQEYFNTTSDPYGHYQISGLNATYSSVLGEGPNGQNGTDYLKGTVMYKMYANKSPYGEGYSNAFGIDANGSVATTSVVIFPKPARIELRADRPYAYANGTDNVKVTAYLYDALGNPVADGYSVNFTVGNATSNAFMGNGFRWTGSDGSLNAPGQRDALRQPTTNNLGSASVQFGWVPAMAAGNNSTVWAYYEGDSSVHASTSIYCAPTSTSTIHVPADYPTIQGAIDAAHAGDRVVVDSGSYYEHVVLNKAISLEGNDTGNGLPAVDGLGGDAVITVTADGASVYGFNVTHANQGICVTSNHTRAVNNIVHDNTNCGIALQQADNSVVLGNTITMSGQGLSIGNSSNSYVKANLFANITGSVIQIYNSDDANVSGNTIYNNNGNGIFIMNSNRTTVIGNKVINFVQNGIGILVFFSQGSSVDGNTVINNEVGIGTLCMNSSDIAGNTVTGNNASGIILSNSIDDNVSGNTVNNNMQYGLTVYYSGANRIYGNTIQSNANAGVYVNNSTGNAFWLNRISGNGVNANISDGSANAWNSTVPLQYAYNGHDYVNYNGNYWGDYNGTDANIDGIGDTPYVIDAHNVDGHPMVSSSPAPSVGPVRNARTGLTYPTIQGAIDDANTTYGDTILVNSSTYKENVVVDKPLVLRGVDTGSGKPVVDGSGNVAIKISADHVSLLGFNVTNASTVVTSGNVNGSTDEGIVIAANYTYVAGNTVNNHAFAGIYTAVTEYNTVANNTLDNNAYGVFMVASSNTFVAGNTANGNPGTGILLLGGVYDNVTGNTANDNQIGIGLVNVNSSNIVDNVADDNYIGLVFSGSSDSSLTGNIVNDNAQSGIAAQRLSRVHVLGNTADNNTQSGISILNSSANRVQGNNITRNANSGFYLDNSSGNVFWQNWIAGNGIDANVSGGSANAWNSTEPTLYSYGGHSYVNYTGNYWVNHTMPDANGDGIGDTPYVIDAGNVDGYPMVSSAPAPSAGPVRNARTGLTYPTIQGAIDDANTTGGDTILVNSGTYKENVVIDKAITLKGVDTGNGTPIVDGGTLYGETCAVNITADGAVLQGFNITHAMYGVFVHSNDTRISGNTIYGDGDGIDLLNTRDCVVTGNTVFNTTNGVGIGFSNNTTLSYNGVNDSSMGILILVSNYTNVLRNVAGNDGNGILMLSSADARVTDNVAANDGYGIILLDTRDVSATGNAAKDNAVIGIGLTKTGSGTLTGNTAYNNTMAGIILSDASHCNVSGNTANNNTGFGIFAYNSSSNAISGNQIGYNAGAGICLNNSTGNALWLNRISGNGINANLSNAGANAWNSTVKVRYTYNGRTYTNYVGNYWGDYRGRDANRNGIGDTPYAIGANNTDRYPMIQGAATAPAPNATMVSDSIPATMVAGQKYRVSITVANTGRMNWTSASSIGLEGVGGANGNASKFGGYRYNIARGTTVYPGNTYTFNFTMTAPKAAGTYRIDYRMIQGSGQWFGDTFGKTITVTQSPVRQR